MEHLHCHSLRSNSKNRMKREKGQILTSEEKICEHWTRFQYLWLLHEIKDGVVQ